MESRAAAAALTEEEAALLPVEEVEAARMVTGHVPSATTTTSPGGSSVTGARLPGPLRWEAVVVEGMTAVAGGMTATVVVTGEEGMEIGGVVVVGGRDGPSLVFGILRSGPIRLPRRRRLGYRGRRSATLKDEDGYGDRQ